MSSGRLRGASGADRWVPSVRFRPLAKWLALAEQLRRRGEEWVPYRGHHPLLDPAKTWKVPDRFDLPLAEQGLPQPTREDLVRLGLIPD